MKDNRRACKDCPETFELIPPVGGEYNIPQESKPAEGKEYIERFYECVDGHRNTIYWVKESGVVSGKYRTIRSSPDIGTGTYY